MKSIARISPFAKGWLEIELQAMFKIDDSKRFLHHLKELIQLK